ncbi:MAG: TIGR03936 family radical SAM-associated protein [Chloroflexi bacterium]|nr:TIGR03936 family radical SAM-associated protein [Chloroflexota bacterium]
MRLRITFSKSGALRYTGHLDLQSIWERTVRRAGLPLSYTQGFHPGPKIQLASALPLGFIGRAEIVDMWINEPGDPLDRPYKAPFWHRDYHEILQPATPPGLVISSVEIVDEHSPALQTQVVSAEYEVTLPRAPSPVREPGLPRGNRDYPAGTGTTSLDPGDTPGLVKGISALLGAASLSRERRGKTYDLRSLIESLELLPADGSESLRLHMRLAAREGATGRPEEVLDALGFQFETTRIERTRLILK